MDINNMELLNDSGLSITTVILMEVLYLRFGVN